MLKLTRAQIEIPRAPRLVQLWWECASRCGLQDDRIDALAEPVSGWLIHHRIDHPENISFVMIAVAQSDGGFLTSEPVREAMRLSFGEADMVISAIRHETAALALRAGNT